MNIQLKQLWRVSRIRALFAVAVGSLAFAAFGQTVTGAMAPASVTAGGSSTLTLSYSGFSSNSTGMNLRVYYNSAAVTPGAVTYANPPGNSQAANSPAAGILAGCTGADTFIRMNWVDFGGTWPTPTAGTLGTVPFTTAATFAANTAICWVEDLTQGAPVRLVSGNTTLGFTAPPTPTVSVVASPTALNDSPANVSTLTFTSSAAAPAGGFSVNITPATANARYSTSCVSPILIAAGTTTATCAVTATPNTTPGDGAVTATTTVLVGTGYAVGTPASAAVTVNDDDIAPSVSVVASLAALSNSTGGTSTYTFTASAAAPAGGLSVTITPPAVSALYTTTCASPIVFAAATTTKTCTVTATTPPTTNATATATVTITGGSAATYSIGTPSSASVVVTSSVPTVTVSASPTALANAVGNVSTVTFTASSAAPAGGLAVPITAPAASAFYSTTCVSPIVIAAGATTASCTITAAVTAPAGGGSATAVVTVLAGPGFTVGASAAASVLVGFVPLPPSLPVPTMSPIALGLLALMIFGFAAFGQRRQRRHLD